MSPVEEIIQGTLDANGNCNCHTNRGCHPALSG
jgi:hypothetical protein